MTVCLSIHESGSVEHGLLSAAKVGNGVHGFGNTGSSPNSLKNINYILLPTYSNCIDLCTERTKIRHRDLHSDILSVICYYY